MAKWGWGAQTTIPCHRKLRTPKSQTASRGKLQKRNAVRVQMCRNHLRTRKFPNCKFWEVGRVLGGKKERRITCHVLALTQGHLPLVIAWKGYEARWTCGVGQYGPSCSAHSRDVPQGQDGCKPFSLPLSQHITKGSAWALGLQPIQLCGTSVKTSRACKSPSFSCMFAQHAAQKRALVYG